MPDSHATEKLREEFDRWAEAGRGEGMERDHLPITLPVLELMGLEPADNVLDIGCGSGWLARLIAERVPEGRVIGVDISDEMVRQARRALSELDERGSNAALGHVMFVTGSAEEIPWDSNFFTKAISVESAYYWPNPVKGIAEIFRVLRERGSAWVLINYYRDNPHCQQWGEILTVPAKLLSAEEWAAMFREAGFTEVAHRRIPDPTPTPAVYTGKWFRDAEQLRAFRAAGALLVHATKPAGASPLVPSFHVL